MSDTQQEMWFDLPAPEPTFRRGGRKARDPNPGVDVYGEVHIPAKLTRHSSNVCPLSPKSPDQVIQ